MNIEQLKETYPGFKIWESHYKIGSKIHISDFYFAKRIFQNSFFANKFAYLLITRMEEVLGENEIRRMSKEGISLVGYGLYAELLLSLVEKFWRKKWNIDEERKLNHNLVSDEPGMKMIKSATLLPNIILIIPIASTFSTALKIEEFITKEKYASKVCRQHFNILHVRDLRPETKDLRAEFGWSEPVANSRKVEVTAYFDSENSKRDEHYFIGLPTLWHAVDRCGKCYPKRFNSKELVDEDCLIETSSTSLVPAVVFGFPTVRKLSEEEDRRTYKFDSSMMKYSVLPNSGGFISYTFNTEEFLLKNRPELEAWLDKIGKTEFLFDGHKHFHTLIISSCHQTNVSFINLVNERLFKSSANIIHYDPENDFIENFEITYGNDINTADKIIFVDDSLKLGTTFQRINDFVSYVIRNRTKGNSTRNGLAEGISECIILMNKSSPYVDELIKSRMHGSRRIYSFANLHLFPTLPVGDYSNFKEEKVKYSQLIEASFLDSLKKYFSIQFGKTLTPLNENASEEERNALRERHLMTLEAIHLIHRFLSVKDNQPDQNTRVRSFIENIKASANTSFKYDIRYARPVLEFHPLEITTIKSLTQYPLTQYAPLKRIAFKWILQLLEEELPLLRKHIHEGTLNYDRFNYLKLLLGRISEINSNYILSEEMFDILELILSEKAFNILYRDIDHRTRELQGAGPVKQEFGKEGASGENEISVGDSGTNREEAAIVQPEGLGRRLRQHVAEFHVFFVAQVKELLYNNDERAIWLEELLSKFSSKGDHFFKQAIRVLRVENTGLIQDFVEYIREEDLWKELYRKSREAHEINEDLSPLEAFFTHTKVTSNARFRKMERYFKKTSQPPAVENKLLQNFLWIIYFLQFDNEMSSLRLSERTGHICDKIRLMLEAKAENVGSLINPGVFLIIVDSQQKPFLVYDRNREGKSLLESESWEESSPFLTEYIRGVSDNDMTYHKTIMELKRASDPERWVDLYSVSADSSIKNLHIEILPQTMNRLILVRLYKRTSNLKTSNMGLLGIYYENNTQLLTDVNRIRYLLLLIQPLSNFVERHHQNNEFRDWVIAENTRKLALLSGHGKEMLGMLAKNDPNFSNIALNLEHLQMIILLDDEVRTKKEEDDNIKRRFNQFYDVKGRQLICRKDFEDIIIMARKIYNAREVEDKVTANIQLRFKLDGDLQFSFNRSILFLIFFELIINAKKNRWHFVGDNPGKFTRNKLKIIVEMLETEKGRKLRLVVGNTCPRRDNESFFDTLRSLYRNVKDNDATAGTALLKKLINKILGGSIQFQEIPVNEEVGWFQTEITLNEMIDATDDSSN